MVSVVAIGCLWGLNWPVVKTILNEMPPLTIRAVAFPIAAILLSIIAIASGQRLWPNRLSEFGPIFVTGILVIFGFNVLATFGQLLTEASNAAIIAYTMPAITAVLAATLLGDRIGPKRAGALLLAMLGIAALLLSDLNGLVAAPAGAAIMVAAAVSWSLGNVALKVWNWSLQPLALTVWFFAASSLLAWPLVLLFEPLQHQTWPGGFTLWLLIYHSVGPMVICYWIWTGMVGRLPVTTAAIATLLAPVVGVASSAWLLGETLDLPKLAALGLIVASITLTLLRTDGDQKKIEPNPLTKASPEAAA